MSRQTQALPDMPKDTEPPVFVNNNKFPVEVMIGGALRSIQPGEKVQGWEFKKFLGIGKGELTLVRGAKKKGDFRPETSVDAPIPTADPPLGSDDESPVASSVEAPATKAESEEGDSDSEDGVTADPLEKDTTELPKVDEEPSPPKMEDNPVKTEDADGTDPSYAGKSKSEWLALVNEQQVEVLMGMKTRKLKGIARLFKINEDAANKGDLVRDLKSTAALALEK